MHFVINKPYTARAIFDPADQPPGAVKHTPLVSYTTDQAARQLLRAIREKSVQRFTQTHINLFKWIQTQAISLLANGISQLTKRNTAPTQ